MEHFSQSRKMAVFVAIILSILLFALDNMIITPALPRILSEIGGVSHINWVFTAYILTSTITTPIYGKLSDIFSRKKMFLIAIAIFIISSMLCGLSQNIYELIVFRGIQGIGGGAIMVTAMSMIGEIFTIQERAKYQGYIGAVFAIASIGGPILGAFITSGFSWRWTFYINLPIGIVAFFIMYALVPKSLHQAKNRHIDYLGAVLLALFLVPLIFFFSAISQTYSVDRDAVILILLSFLAFLLFYSWEKKSSAPIFSISLFKDRHFVVPAVLTFMNAIILFAATLYLQIYAQKVMNLSIKDSGILLSAIMIPLTLSSPIYGQIVSRTGRYKAVVIAGASILFIAIVSFTVMLMGEPSVKILVLHLIPLGIGMGAMMSIFNMIIQMVYPRERMGEVTGALSLVRGIGGTFGTAMLGFVFSYYVKDLNGDVAFISKALVSIFILLSVLCGISLFTSFYMKEKRVIH